MNEWLTKYKNLKANTNDIRQLAKYLELMGFLLVFLNYKYDSLTKSGQMKNDVEDAIDLVFNQKFFISEEETKRMEALVKKVD